MKPEGLTINVSPHYKREVANSGGHLLSPREVTVVPAPVWCPDHPGDTVFFEVCHILKPPGKLHGGSGRDRVSISLTLWVDDDRGRCFLCLGRFCERCPPQGRERQRLTMQTLGRKIVLKA